jgi:hypothetical protein
VVKNNWSYCRYIGPVSLRVLKADPALPEAVYAAPQHPLIKLESRISGTFAGISGLE